MLGQRQLKEKVVEKCGVGYGFVYFNNKTLGLGSILGFSRRRELTEQVCMHIERAFITMANRLWSS